MSSTFVILKQTSTEQLERKTNKWAEEKKVFNEKKVVLKFGGLSLAALGHTQHN